MELAQLSVDKGTNLDGAARNGAWGPRNQIDRLIYIRGLDDRETDEWRIGRGIRLCRANHRAVPRAHHRWVTQNGNEAAASQSSSLP